MTSFFEGTRENILQIFWALIIYDVSELKLEHTVKFIYSEKATIFCEISTIDLSYVVTVKSTVEISQNFVGFSEYMNFIISRL